MQEKPMIAFFATFSQRYRVSALWGWFHIALLVTALNLAAFDAGLKLGINPWSKPMRFLISMAMLLWTLARLAAHLPGPRWTVKVICWSESLMVLGGTACISLQAVRNTPFVKLLHLTRGITIALAVGLLLQLLVLFSVKKVLLPRLYLWRIRIGIVVFGLSSWQGGMIVSVGLMVAVLVLVVLRRNAQFIKSRLHLPHHSRLDARRVGVENKLVLQGNE